MIIDWKLRIILEYDMMNRTASKCEDVGVSRYISGFEKYTSLCSNMIILKCEAKGAVNNRVLGV